MLFDPKKRLKAKKYEYVNEPGIDKDDPKRCFHLIRPAGSETETISIYPTQIVNDFIDLIKEYAGCRYFPRMIDFGHLNYKGIRNKTEQNRITTANRGFDEEEKRMLEAIMGFVNKYGLFGLLNDGAIGFDYNMPANEEGEYVFTKYPHSAVVYDPISNLYSRVPYEEYIRPYFPGCDAREAAEMEGAERVLRYSEYMEDILQNRRFLDCVEYIAGIDKVKRGKLPVYDLNATVYFKDEVPQYDVESRSLIQYCHAMFFMNELGAGDRCVSICQYRRCRKPFIGNRMYCSDECMHNANKGRKK